MELHRNNGTLKIARISELTASHARTLKAAIDPQLSPDLRAIEFDLSALRSIDGSGLAALVSLYQTVLEKSSGITLRLVNPSAPVQQMIELARLHHLFEIAPSRTEVNGLAA